MSLYYFCFNKNVPINIFKEEQKKEKEIHKVEDLFIAKPNYHINKVFTMESSSYPNAIKWVLAIWLPKVQGFWYPKDTFFSLADDTKLTDYKSKSGIHFAVNMNLKSNQKDTSIIDVMSIFKCIKGNKLEGYTYDARKWIKYKEG